VSSRSVVAGALLLAASLGGATDSAAQDEPSAAVTAWLESSQISLGETVDLVIEIEPPGLSTPVEEPDLPRLPAVVVGRSRASQVQVVGARVRRVIVHRFTLQPLDAGTMRIPPLEIAVGDRSLVTSALDLEVIDRGDGWRLGRREGEPDGGPPPFFVTARVDRDHAYVGEQLTLMFAFYHDPRAPLAESPDYDPPDTPGFWRIELDPEPILSTELVGGRTYRVQRFHYALFPLTAGRHEIRSASVRIVEPDPREWWRQTGARTLETDPLIVTAESLPSKAPAGFDGAVGRYTLEGEIGRSTTPAGVPIELELTVSGVGNPTAIGAPVLPAWPDVVVRDPTVETETEIVRRTVTGEARFRYLLSPQMAGHLDLGVARIAYFDPEAGTYGVDTLALGEIEVVPSSSAPAVAREPKPAGPTLRPARRPQAPRPRGLASRVDYWFALAAPWLAWLGAVAAGRLSRRKQRGVSRREAIDDLDHAQQAIVDGESGAVQRAIAALDATRLAWKGTWPESATAAASEARAALEATAYGGGAAVDAARALELLVATLRVDRSGSGRRAAGTLTLLMLVLFPAASALAQNDPDPLIRWEEANQAYRGGAFDDAVEVYRELLEVHADPNLEANLAAALWRRGDRGEALLRYQRALELAPRDRAMRRNVERLRSELGDPPGGRSRMTAILGWVRLDELLTLLLAASTVSVGLFVLARRHRWASRMAVVTVVVAIAIGIVAVGHGLVLAPKNQAMALETLALSAEPGGPPIAAVAEGSVVTLLEADDGTARIQAPGLPAGWVAGDRLGRLDSILR
jgi:tetratricopeptide (TPR) repeat protein